MIFVDTGAWYASLGPTDPDHGRAVQWLAENHSPLLTTDYVIPNRTEITLSPRTAEMPRLTPSREFDYVALNCDEVVPTLRNQFIDFRTILVKTFTSQVSAASSPVKPALHESHLLSNGSCSGGAICL